MVFSGITRPYKNRVNLNLPHLTPVRFRIGQRSLTLLVIVTQGINLNPDMEVPSGWFGLWGSRLGGFRGSPFLWIRGPQWECSGGPD